MVRRNSLKALSQKHLRYATETKIYAHSSIYRRKHDYFKKSKNHTFEICIRSLPIVWTYNKGENNAKMI